jgi:hypothetical protein
VAGTSSGMMSGPRKGIAKEPPSKRRKVLTLSRVKLYSMTSNLLLFFGLKLGEDMEKGEVGDDGDEENGDEDYVDGVEDEEVDEAEAEEEVDEDEGSNSGKKLLSGKLASGKKGGDKKARIGGKLATGKGKKGVDKLLLVGGKPTSGKTGNHAVPSQEDDDRVLMEGERFVVWRGDKNKYSKDGKPSGEKGVWMLPKPKVETREKGDEEDNADGEVAGEKGDEEDHADGEVAGEKGDEEDHADGEVAGEKGDEEDHADGEEGDSEVEEEEARESLRRWNLLEREFCKVSLIPAAMKSTDPCLKKMKALSEGGQSSFSAWLLHLSLDNTILIVKALSLVGPTKVSTWLWNVFWTFVERVLVL